MYKGRSRQWKHVTFKALLSFGHNQGGWVTDLYSFCDHHLLCTKWRICHERKRWKALLIPCFCWQVLVKKWQANGKKLHTPFTQLLKGKCWNYQYRQATKIEKRLKHWHYKKNFSWIRQLPIYADTRLADLKSVQYLTSNVQYLTSSILAPARRD